MIQFIFTAAFNFSTVLLLLPARPQYSPNRTQVAIIGQPFDFDFNFTGSTIPTSVQWRKNGRIFRGDGERVVLDHTGIMFTRVLHHDAGQYQVEAKSSDGTARGYSLFKGSHLTTTLDICQFCMVMITTRVQLLPSNWSLTKGCSELCFG